jgi:hypothetical protein
MSGTTTSQDPLYEVVWPLGRVAYGSSATHQRVADLRGKVIGELWDHVFHGDRILAIVREQLAARFPGIRFIPYAVFGNLHGPQQRELIAAVPALLKEHRCDAVISLIGA